MAVNIHFRQRPGIITFQVKEVQKIMGFEDPKQVSAWKISLHVSVNKALEEGTAQRTWKLSTVATLTASFISSRTTPPGSVFKNHKYMRI